MVCLLVMTLFFGSSNNKPQISYRIEMIMSEKKVIHEVKLQKSVVIILGLLAFGVCANVLKPSFSVQNALADLDSYDTIKVRHEGSIRVY